MDRTSYLLVSPQDIKPLLAALRVAADLWPFTRGQRDGIDLAELPQRLREAITLLEHLEHVEVTPIWF